MQHSGCGTAVETKEENIRDWKWKPMDRRAEGGAKRTKTKEVKHEDTSNNRAVFHLREQGVGDECGQVPGLVLRSEEFFDGKIRWVVGGKEDVRYVV